MPRIFFVLRTTNGAAYRHALGPTQNEESFRRDHISQAIPNIYSPHTGFRRLAKKTIDGYTKWLHDQTKFQIRDQHEDFGERDNLGQDSRGS